MIYYPSTTKEFEELIKNKKVLVDFYTTWCGPCRLLAEVLEDIDIEHAIGEIDIVKVDCEQLDEISMNYNIQAVPTYMLIENNKTIKQGMGYASKNDIVNFCK